MRTSKGVRLEAKGSSEGWWGWKGWGGGTLEMCSEDVLRRKDWDSPANMDQFLIGDGSAH